MNRKQKQHKTIVPGNSKAVNVIGNAREDLSFVLKLWKKRIKDSNVLEIVKQRKTHIKDNVIRRQEKSKAAYRQKIYDLNNKF